MKRRDFLATTAFAAGALLTPSGWTLTRAADTYRLDPRAVPKYTRSLPCPSQIDATGGGTITMRMDATVQDLLGLGARMFTPVWGYGPEAVTFPGPTLTTMRGRPLRVEWQNDLRFQHLQPVDTSIHIANPADHPDPTPEGWARQGIPAVPHLHGGRTESASDGLPEAWWTPGRTTTGAFFEKTRYLYDNDQEAATLWYHDHALGITRLNVHAGLAGFYLLRDANEQHLIDEHVLPGGAYDVEIVIQDRMFTEIGELYYPSTLEEFYAPEELDEITFPTDRASVLPEFFGDVILVNGAAWPKLAVEPRKYRLRLLNGSDARFYVLEFHRPDGSAVPFLQIGTDNGFLERPVVISRLLLAPGERADLVVDFARFEGTTILLRNFGPDEPFKGIDERGEIGAVTADPETTGQIMRFDVQLRRSPVPEASVQPGKTRLRSTPIPHWKAFEREATRSRSVALFEGTDQYGRLQPLLGVAEPNDDTAGQTVNGSLAWFAPITENPERNTVEIWEIYNATEDAHPIHLHLVKFLVLNRQPFSADVISKVQPAHGGAAGVGGVLKDILLSGSPERPPLHERGWKDTVVAFPEQVTRIAARFDREGRYVWHCHILSHEDHEMMRPYYVGPVGSSLAERNRSTEPLQFTAHPNPFNPATTLTFKLPREGHVSLAIYDSAGRQVARLVNERLPAGIHQARFNASRLASGLYLTRLAALGTTATGTLVLVK